MSSFVEVVDTLDAEGPHLDILLVSVDPHIDKGMKMLKYISEEFQHIPVIISKLMLFDLQLVFSLFFYFWFLEYTSDWKIKFFKMKDYKRDKFKRFTTTTTKNKH